jgi:hypothetical protein
MRNCASELKAGTTKTDFRFDLEMNSNVIASAAKQSILSLHGDMDCFAALAMTAQLAGSSPIPSW